MISRLKRLFHNKTPEERFIAGFLLLVAVMTILVTITAVLINNNLR